MLPLSLGASDKETIQNIRESTVSNINEKINIVQGKAG